MLPFFKVVVVDFEFQSSPGGVPRPVCVVFKELNSGEIKRVWLEDSNLSSMVPPYPLDQSTLYVAYYSSAEWSCHLALNWPFPAYVIDLYAEYRCLTNGLPGIKNGLLNACEYFEVPTIQSQEKDDMRLRILKGAPYSAEEKEKILDYCESDVKETSELFKRMSPYIDFPRALFRGEYMKVIAEIEHNGVPIDCKTLDRLKRNWVEIQRRLILETDPQYRVYEGTTFKAARFEKYLGSNGIPWPRTEAGNLDLKDQTFKDMSKTYPQLQALRDLRFILSKFKLSNLAVGQDWRNRVLLSPLGTKTGRNSPSNSKFIFGPAVWLRSLIQPEPGKALISIDYSQQEFEVAAVLSGDKAMQVAYESGDPYLSFAKQAGAAPPDATKQTHRAIRDCFKLCALGVQYGMAKDSLSLQLGKPTPYAGELIHHHKRVYRKYWDWSEHVLNSALVLGKITTCYGWQYIPVGRSQKEARTIKNFPCQATGAEILRVACILLSEDGIKIAAPVHDALLVECDDTDVEDTVRRAQELMEEASEIVLGRGHRINTEAYVIRHPDRYSDERGVETWQRVMKILEEIENQSCDTETQV